MDPHTAMLGGSMTFCSPTLIRQRVASWLINRSIRLGLSTSEHRRVGVFDVWVWTDPDEADQLLISKLAEALQLVAGHDPARFTGMQHSMPRIWIGGDASSLGSYLHDLNLCVLDPGYVRDPRTNAAKLALTLVHEATHAQLYVRGIGYPERFRTRIERLCVQSEIAFARRLPSSLALARAAHKRRAEVNEIWSPENRRAYQERMIRQQGYPEWMTRLILWLRPRPTPTASVLGRAGPRSDH